MKDTVKIALGAVVLAIIIYLVGRWTKSSDSDKSKDYLDWKDDIEKAAKNSSNQYVAPDSVQNARADTLRKAFSYKIGGFIPGTDEEAIYEVFDGFESIADFARFNALFKWNGMNLTQSLQDELNSSELDIINTTLRENLGITLIE